MATLERVAATLAGINRRRKAVIVISEGIDYDVARFRSPVSMVRVERPGVRVRARPGYFAGPLPGPDEPRGDDSSSRLDALLQQPLPGGTLTADVQAATFRGEGNQARIVITVQFGSAGPASNGGAPASARVDGAVLAIDRKSGRQFHVRRSWGVQAPSGRIRLVEDRRFQTEDELVVAAEVYGIDREPKRIDVRTRLVAGTGETVLESHAVLPPGPRQDRHRHVRAFLLRDVKPGAYVVVVEAAAAGERPVTRSVPITIVSGG